ncbi:hypothetical protein [Nocardia sp. NBC_01009]|uniref:hypothetical protein n=1 Tax=Nocardia sp. NBC_01009 TaxID=2975996 RepID=UPI00386A961C|nr:hypothetical protein OHA42_18155 [Nocardia sp. NBC_01009]
MDVRFISDDGVRAHPATDLKGLLDRPDGLVWVNVPTWDDEFDRFLMDPPSALHALLAPARARRLAGDHR